MLAFFGSVAFQVPPNFVTRPRLDELNAARIAWQALSAEPTTVPQPGKPRAARLVIWGDVDSKALAPVFLCWEVPVSAVDAEGRGPVGRYYIDAQNGAVLHYTNDKHECGFDKPHAATPPVAPPAVYTVMGYARTGASSSTNTTFRPAPATTIESAAGGGADVVCSALTGR